MALTRSFLKGMGITDEQISAIIEAHTESTDALKAQRDNYKAYAEKLPAVQQELDTLKAKGDGGWQKKYEDEHSAFEAYKTAESEKATKQAKIDAYRALLTEAKVSDKAMNLIINSLDLTQFEIGEDGKLKDADKLTAAIKTDYADFITTEGTEGAQVTKPLGNDGGTFEAMTLQQKMEYANANPNDAQVKAWLES